MIEIKLSDNGRWDCPFCDYTTQLANKAQRHLTKKHGVSAAAIHEVDTVVCPANDEEE